MHPSATPDTRDRSGPDPDLLDRRERLVARLIAHFRTLGAARVEPAALQPADRLLDLYGEDIRARAYITLSDGAEAMLRPDFTVPIAERHLLSGHGSATYCYAGPVWRRQAAGAARASEYLQVGVERLGDRDRPGAEARIFGAIATALDWPRPGLAAATGDMGLVLAAIDALATSEDRRRALRRHIWRPARFQRLMERYAGRTHPKAALIDAVAGDPGAAVAAAGVAVGKRSAAEVMARLERLAADRATPPLGEGEVALIAAILGLRKPAATALIDLRALTTDAPGLTAAVDRFEARLAALDSAGLDAGSLPFEGSYGRTTLEYYDGFVFGIFAPDRPDLPPVASGGRYDALTRAMGADIPAVGGIIRPETLLDLERGP